MTRKSSRKTIKNRKPRKKQRSRKPVKNKIKPVKRSRKPVKRSRKPRRKSSKRKNTPRKFRVKGPKGKSLRERSRRLLMKRQKQAREQRRRRESLERKLKKTARDILQRKKYSKLGEMNVFKRYYNYFYDYLTGNSEIPRVEINSLAARLASEQVEEERQKRERRIREEMAQYPSDDDSDYVSGDDSDDASGDDSDYDNEAVEVQDRPESAKNVIGAGHYKIDTRNAIDPRRFTETLELLEIFGFFFTRALGAGVSGSAGLYDFIPARIEGRAKKVYDTTRSQFPPLNPSESAVVTVKILNIREDTDKEIAINKHLMRFCNSRRYRNYFGGTIPCPFLISSELPFVSKRPGYKFQWSEAMNMNLHSYCDAYIWEQLDSGRYPFQIVTRIMLQLTSGMIDLHQAGVPHTDFKPDQCLLKFRDFDLNAVSKVLIADFGHSGLLSRNGEWTYRPAGGGGAYGFRPLSNNFNFRRPINYFHNDVFALGVTFSQLLGSGEILDLAFLYNAQKKGRRYVFPRLEDIAAKMKSESKSNSKSNSKSESKSNSKSNSNVLLQLGNESLGRRISRCLNGVFGRKKNKVREVYNNVLQLLLIGYENDGCLQECLRLLTTLIE